MAKTNGTHVNGTVNGTVNGDGSPEELIEISPYRSKAISVLIGANGIEYTVLQAMLDQYPELAARMNPGKAGTIIRLPEVDEDVAHTLVHFIYTNEYETRPHVGAPGPVRATTDFQRSVLAYCAARLYSIGQLEEAARNKMESLSKQISLYEMQEVVDAVSPKLPENELWFPDHLYQWTKGKLQENDDLVTDEKLLSLIGKTALFDRAVLRSIAEKYREKSAALDLLSGMNAHTQTILSTQPIDGHHAMVGDAAAGSMEEEETSVTVPNLGDGAAILEKVGSAPPRASSDVDAKSNLLVSPDVKSPHSVPEDWSVQPMDAESTNTGSIAVPDDDIETVVNGVSVITREDELAKTDNAGKATDSDVEAARAKSGKKKNKGKKKKALSETQVNA